LKDLVSGLAAGGGLGRERACGLPNLTNVKGGEHTTKEKLFKDMSVEVFTKNLVWWGSGGPGAKVGDKKKRIEKQLSTPDYGTVSGGVVQVRLRAEHEINCCQKVRAQ